MHTPGSRAGTRFALRLDAGMTLVDDSPIDEEDNAAYGGQKQSGLDRLGGGSSVEEFTAHHCVFVQRTRRPYPFCGCLS